MAEMRARQARAEGDQFGPCHDVTWSLAALPSGLGTCRTDDVSVMAPATDVIR